jgi:aconitate hydratase
VLPLQYEPGTTRQTLGLTGREQVSISGISQGLTPGGRVTVTATQDGGKPITFAAIVRLNSKVELDYYRNGGILQRVLRMFVKGEA